MDLKLDKKVEPLPVDSTFDVRLKGAIGLKYLQVTPGHSARPGRRGDRAAEPVGLRGRPRPGAVDVRSADPRRRGAQSTIGFSDALAGRGERHQQTRSARSCRWSATSGRWPATWPRRQTDLGRLLPRPRAVLGGAGAGRRRRRPALYSNLDTTFTALAGVAVPYLQEWISQTPPTFSTVIADSPDEQAFLNDTAGLFMQLRPGLRDAAAERAGAGRRVRRRDAEPPRHHRAGPARCSAWRRRSSSYGANPAVSGGWTG